MSLTQNRHALKVKVVDSDEKYQNKNAIKVKIEGGGGGTVTVDDALSKTSENPVQNKVITNKVEDIETAVASKQNALTAGTNITIENDVISATGGGGDSAPAIYATSAWNSTGGRYEWTYFKDEGRTTRLTWQDFLDILYTAPGKSNPAKELKIFVWSGGYGYRLYFVNTASPALNNFTPNVSEEESIIYAASFAVASTTYAKPDSMMEEYGAPPELRAEAYSCYIDSEVNFSDNMKTWLSEGAGGKLLSSQMIAFDEYGGTPPTSGSTKGAIYVSSIEGSPKLCKVYVCVATASESGSVDVWCEVAEGTWDWP